MLYNTTPSVYTSSYLICKVFLELVLCLEEEALGSICPHFLRPGAYTAKDQLLIQSPLVDQCPYILCLVQD